MILNRQEILPILKSFKIDPDKGLLCLLGYYHGLDIDTVCDEDTVRAINLTKIVEKQYHPTRATVLVWNVALFEGQNLNWVWVATEYNHLWYKHQSRKASNPDVTRLMKEFFKKYPEYRKEDVMKATLAYFSTVKDFTYLKDSAKFIFEGAGAKIKSALLGWCEKTKEASSQNNLKGNLIT